MQTVVPLALEGVAAQLGITGHRPDLGGNVILLGKNPLRVQHAVEDRPAPEKVDERLVLVAPRQRRRPEPVHPLENPFRHLRTFRHRRHQVGLVLARQVIKDVLPRLVHPADALLHDHRQFVSVRRVVADAVRNHARQHQRMPVLMLKPLARQRRPARRAADQEPLPAGVREGPDHVADALEPEHRVKEIKRDHVHAVGGVGRARRRERSHRTRLGDALLEKLTLLRLAVVKEKVGIHRVVKLPLVSVNAVLAEQRVHPERPRLVRHDRNDQFADLLVVHQTGQDPHHRHRRGGLAVLRSAEELRELVQFRRREPRGLHAPPGLKTSQRRPPLLQVADLLAVFRRFVKRHLRQLVVRDRNVEAIAELAQLLLIELLLLVRDVAAFTRFAQSVTLDRLGEDDGRLSLVFDGGSVRGVHLDGIVPAAAHAEDLLVRQRLRELQKPRVDAEEFLPRFRAGLDAVPLVVAVERVGHALDQQIRIRTFQQRIPVTAPDHLDHVPTRPAERRLQFLNDLPVSAHRPVKTLKIAIDHERQIVQPLARGQRQRPERLRFVRLAVAEETPDPLALRILDPAIVQVAVEARLVDRRDRAKSHRNRGELPEIRHQPRMRVRRNLLPDADAAAEMREVVRRESSFQKRTGVNARRGVSLKKYLIASAFRVLAAEVVMKPDLVERRRGLKCRNMSADARELPVRAHHHRHRVPAHQAFDPPLDRTVPGIRRRLVRRDRVHIRRVQRRRDGDAAPPTPVNQPAKQK
ncbi:MAG: hypothetical protein FLDDKLPJ_00036 [Phycisphaerae bacterium]|nr:hypothetical protein [Phycisphaerae bacterium]